MNGQKSAATILKFDRLHARAHLSVIFCSLEAHTFETVGHHAKVQQEELDN